MVKRTLLVLALVAAPAYAESKLDRARKAIDSVKYDDAQKLLVDALDDGGNSPADVAEIYRLSASTAVVLERRELAEQYYRRWLALDPSASLSNDLAPKIREPFVKAQAYMNAHGRLVAKVTRSPSGIVVVVENDPLNMAVSAAVDGGTAAKLDADRKALLGAGARAAILDEHGNRLVELDVPAEVTAAPPIEAPATRVEERRVPLLRRGVFWAFSAGAVIGSGLVIGSFARDAQNDARAFALDSSNHTFAEYEDARDRRDRYALIANGLFIAGGALAVTAVIMFATQPSSTVVVPAASRDSIGVTVAREF